jgi:hypothetical protein
MNFTNSPSLNVLADFSWFLSPMNCLSMSNLDFANHSCESAINLLLHDWRSSLEKNKEVLVVLSDLKRAFETIDRELLVKKFHNMHVLMMSAIGLRFKSYLSKRHQRTKFNDGELVKFNKGWRICEI